MHSYTNSNILSAEIHSEEFNWPQAVFHFRPLCMFYSLDGGVLLQYVFEGDFEAALLSPQVLDLLAGDPEEGENIEAYLERRILAYINNVTEDQKSDR